MNLSRIFIPWARNCPLQFTLKPSDNLQFLDHNNRTKYRRMGQQIVGHYFGWKARSFVITYICRMGQQDFCSNILVSKHNFCSNVLDSKLDFFSSLLDLKKDLFWNIWITSRNFVHTFLFWSKTFVQKFDFEARILFKHFRFKERPFFKHFGLQTCILF